MSLSKLDRPILLFGMPRSGTTWLGKIFDSHPRTLYRHEPDSFQPLSDIPLLADPSDAAILEERLRSYLSEVVAMRAEAVCGKQPIFPKVYAAAGSTGLHWLGANVSKAAARLGLSVPVLGAPRLESGDDWRLAWKSIESLGRLGLLLDAIEDACAVQILRHPCGYVASVLRGEAAQHFTHGGAAEDWGIFGMLSDTPQARRRSLTLDSLKLMLPVERLAWRWVLFNEKAFEDSSGTGRHLVLYYEELCSDPQRVTRHLFDFTGLEWNAQTERFLADSTGKSRSDYYSVFKDPLESAWKWQQQLDPAQTNAVLAVLGQSELGAAYLSKSAWNRLSA
jgi:hypothetical protein